MPTLYHSASRFNALIIHGLDANPVYLLLYLEPEKRGIFIQCAEFRNSLFRTGTYAFEAVGPRRTTQALETA